MFSCKTKCFVDNHACVLIIKVSLWYFCHIFLMKVILYGFCFWLSKGTVCLTQVTGEDNAEHCLKEKKREENPAGFHKTWPPITIDMFPFNLQRRGGRKQDVTTRRGNSLPAELEWEWAEWAFQSVGGTEHIQTQHEALSSRRKTGNNPERHRRLRGGETSRTSAERLYWPQNTAQKYTHQQNQYEHMV